MAVLEIDRIRKYIIYVHIMQFDDDDDDESVMLSVWCVLYLYVHVKWQYCTRTYIHRTAIIV